MSLGFHVPSDAFAAEGDITAVRTQSEGNNLEHDTSIGKFSSLVQVDSDTYALAYMGIIMMVTSLHYHLAYCNCNINYINRGRWRR